MLKLLIVDDEKAVRDRLSGIDWSAYGIGEIDFAEHGLIGLQKVYAWKPDIVLSDIQMPVMNGIDMIRQIHEKFPWISVVVLTGYDNFEYIRACMRSAVVDYILKPINEKELDETFRKLAAAKKDEDEEKTRYETLRFQKQEIIRGLRRRFFRHYFTERMTEDEIEESSAYAEINLEGNDFSVAVLRPDLDGRNAKEVYGDELELIVFALDNVLSEYTEKNDRVSGRVLRDSAECQFLITGRLSREEALRLTESLKETVYTIAELLGTTVSAAVGRPATKTNILASLRSAEELLDRNREHDAFLYAEGGGDLEEEPQIREEESLIPPDDASKMKLITRAAIDFIDKNYTRTITLDDVAEHVFLSPTYVSYLFRTEVKMNFINYLTTKRMEKAKELLKDPRQRIYEISTSVGYENSRYFSSIFKKYTGQTPVDYRSSLGVEE